MTFQQLYESLKRFVEENPDHEALERQVVVRLGVTDVEVVELHSEYGRLTCAGSHIEAIAENAYKEGAR